MDTQVVFNFHALTHSLRATRCFFGDVVPVTGGGGGFFSYTAKRNFVFHFFKICVVMVELSFSRRRHPKTLTYLFPEFSSPKTDVWVPQFEMVRPKNSKRSFLDILWKTLHSQFFVSVCSGLCQRNGTWTQRNIVFGMGWTWVARSTQDFSENKHYSHKPWRFDAKVFDRVSKKKSFQNVRPSCSKSTT